MKGLVHVFLFVCFHIPIVLLYIYSVWMFVYLAEIGVINVTIWAIVSLSGWNV